MFELLALQDVGLPVKALAATSVELPVGFRDARGDPCIRRVVRFRAAGKGRAMILGRAGIIWRIGHHVGRMFMGGDVCATHVNPSSLSVTKPRRLGNLPACNRRSLTRLSLSNCADRHHLHSRLAPAPRRRPGLCPGGGPAWIPYVPNVSHRALNSLSSCCALNARLFCFTMFPTNCSM